jgi:hypothetical protein
MHFIMRHPLQWGGTSQGREIRLIGRQADRRDCCLTPLRTGDPCDAIKMCRRLQKLNNRQGAV